MYRSNSKWPSRVLWQTLWCCFLLYLPFRIFRRLDLGTKSFWIFCKFAIKENAFLGTQRESNWIWIFKSCHAQRMDPCRVPASCGSLWRISTCTPWLSHAGYLKWKDWQSYWWFKFQSQSRLLLKTKALWWVSQMRKCYSLDTYRGHRWFQRIPLWRTHTYWIRRAQAWDVSAWLLSACRWGNGGFRIEPAHIFKCADPTLYRRGRTKVLHWGRAKGWWAVRARQKERPRWLSKEWTWSYLS